MVFYYWKPWYVIPHQEIKAQNCLSLTPKTKVALCPSTLIRLPLCDRSINTSWVLAQQPIPIDDAYTWGSQTQGHHGTPNSAQISIRINVYSCINCLHCRRTSRGSRWSDMGRVQINAGCQSKICAYTGKMFVRYDTLDRIVNDL